MGIIQIEVQDIPSPIKLPGQKNKYSFAVVHDPMCDEEEENYSHSEVRWYKNAQYKKNLKVSDEIKKYFRTKLTKKIVVHTPPKR